MYAKWAVVEFHWMLHSRYVFSRVHVSTSVMHRQRVRCGAACRRGPPESILRSDCDAEFYCSRCRGIAISRRSPASLRASQDRINRNGTEIQGASIHLICNVIRLKIVRRLGRPQAKHRPRRYYSRFSSHR